ncbi:MAG TPA: phosphoribosylanthranilate isomerase [Acidobacteriaceae bacterium]|nr:phosphoribosylanthranilate isomerase [Acidobacteriaceae bacterium]
MWIKICGNTNLEDARLALESGANAVGFVFASSPRQVTRTQAQHICEGLPPTTEKYGVFVDSSFAEIMAAIKTCDLNGVQLHRSADPDLPARLREHFSESGQKLTIVTVLNLAARDLQGQGHDPVLTLEHAFAEARTNPAIDAVLVDSSTVTAVGGTGTSFDWAAARDSFLRATVQQRLIVAGGLRPENVRQAISMLRPWGVDVVSGVERYPGRKDGAKLREFIRAARAAEAGLPEATVEPAPEPGRATGDSTSLPPQ